MNLLIDNTRQFFTISKPTPHMVGVKLSQDICCGSVQQPAPILASQARETISSVAQKHWLQTGAFGALIITGCGLPLWISPQTDVQ